MTNADKFKATFGGLYATELWVMPEKDFLDWLNKEYVEEGSRDIILPLPVIDYYYENR